MNKKELMNLLNEKQYKQLHIQLNEMNVVDIATLFTDLSEEQRMILFRVLEKSKAAEVFSYLDNDLRKELISSFSDQQINTLLNEMYTDDAVDFLSELPANLVTQLLENLDFATRHQINQLLKYPNDSAGSIMTMEFIELHPNMNVAQALDKIRHVGIDSETVYTCYIVEKHKLLGIVSAKSLMIHDPDTSISDLMITHYISIHTMDDKEVAAKLFRKYGLIAIPVVDSEGCIVGIVTFDDAIDVLTQETTEDMHRMAAMSENDEPYLKTSVWNHAKHRILWLLILMLSATITGTIITQYENAFQTVPLLVSFIPMLMDTGGNCGTQSSTLVIRALAIDELHFKDIFKVLWKEFRVALLVSSALAFVNGVRIYLMYQDLQLAIVIAISLVATIIISKLVGCCLPIFASKLKMDPAIMAAPLITTIVDTCSIIIYFNIATIIFRL